MDGIREIIIQYGRMGGEGGGEVGGNLSLIYTVIIRIMKAFRFQVTVVGTLLREPVQPPYLLTKAGI